MVGALDDVVYTKAADYSNDSRAHPNMDMIRDFFTANETVLFFVYGQVYFILALSITLRSHPPSQLEMARTLPLLAAFGFIQALVKWGDVFIPVQKDYIASRFFPAMQLFQLLLLGLSFAFLLAFGLQMMSSRSWDPHMVRRLPFLIYLFWAGATLAAWLFDLASFDDIILMADAASWCTCGYLNQATIALQPVE